MDGQVEVRLERLGCRDEFVTEGSQDLFASGAGGEGAVHGAVRALVCAGFIRPSRPGIPGRLVDTKEKYRAVFVENILRPVAVVDVPVGDQHSLDTMFALRIAGGECNVVKHAEAHALLRPRVMARRKERERMSQAVVDVYVDEQVRAVGDKAPDWLSTTTNVGCTASI